MSFFSDKTPEEYWRFFDRQLALIPNTQNRKELHRYLLEREKMVKYSTLGTNLQHIKAFGIYLSNREWRDASRDDIIMFIKESRGKQGRTDR